MNLIALSQTQPKWVRAGGLLLVLLLLFALEESLGLHSSNVQIWLFSFLPVLFSILCVPATQVSLIAGLWCALMAYEALRTPLILETFYLVRLSALLVMAGLCIWISRQRQTIDHQQLRLELKANRLEALSDQLGAQLATSRRATGLAHEIRQPLTIIQLESRQLLNKLQASGVPADSPLAESARLLHTSAAELNRTIGAMANLLRSARSETDDLDLTTVVLSAIESVQLQLERVGVALTLNGLDQPQPMRGDAEQLRVACLNLLRNAIDALREVKPNHRSLAVWLESTQDQLCLHVEDSGAGLSGSLSDLIQLGSQKSTGMGQGLFIVRRIARNHNGSLEGARSATLGGAELRLTLPRGC
ncbi:MAG: sensor histidine kinase [Vulcanococcus sp.]